MHKEIAYNMSLTCGSLISIRTSLYQSLVNNIVYFGIHEVHVHIRTHIDTTSLTYTITLCRF